MVPVRRAPLRYTIELTATFLLFFGLMLVARVASKMTFASPVLKSALLVSPALGVVLTAIVIYRYFRASDEHFRLRLLQALSISAAVVGVISMGALFFIPLGLPILPLWLAWPIMATTWIAVVAVRELRDRSADRGTVNALRSFARGIVPYLLAVALPLGALYAVGHLFAQSFSVPVWVLVGALPFMALAIRSGARVARGDEE